MIRDGGAEVARPIAGWSCNRGRTAGRHRISHPGRQEAGRQGSNARTAYVVPRSHIGFWKKGHAIHASRGSG
jgi:hypothetical protein